MFICTSISSDIELYTVSEVEHLVICVNNAVLVYFQLNLEY